MERLPIELMIMVCGPLDPHSIFNLALSCRHFRYVLRNDDICRSALEKYAPYSAALQEATKSKRYAYHLRRIVKTQNAVANARPFAVAFVAFAGDFVYCNGMLCYTDGHDALRLLDLHRPTTREVVIEIGNLIRSVQGDGLGQSQCGFRPVHYSSGIVSCLYTPPKTQGLSRLIVVDIQARKLLRHRPLDRRRKVFVRNDRQHLYYGIYSGTDGAGWWILKFYDIQKGEWSPDQLDLDNLAGSDMGANVCFEIIDSYLYGLSSLASDVADGTDSISYYSASRSLVGSSRPQDTQTSDEHILRRNHGDGPIDDRWSTLRLEKDPLTGKVMIVECRREHLVASEGSPRTSYRTELEFPDSETGNENLAASAKSQQSSISHSGDRSSDDYAVRFSHCFLRSYNTSCETFIDLVDRSNNYNANTLNLQLRSISYVRTAQPTRVPLVNDAGLEGETTTRTNKVSWWPQDHSALEKILNPLREKSQTAAVLGTVDDRSIVYAIKGQHPSGKNCLIYISFDAAINLNERQSRPGSPKDSPRSEAHGAAPGLTLGDIPRSNGGVPHVTQMSCDLEEAKSREPAWMKEESAMYLALRTEMCKGGTETVLNFALDASAANGRN